MIRIFTSIGLLAAASACVELPPAQNIQFQQQAVNACAREEGAQFPIKVRVEIRSSNYISTRTARIVSSDTMTQAQADRINACVEQKIELGVLDVVPSAAGSPLTLPTTPQATTVEPVVQSAFTPSPRTALPQSTENCRASGSVLSGGAGYCTAQ